MGQRRRARECALMILYAADVRQVLPSTLIEGFFASFVGTGALDPPPSYRPKEAHDRAFRLNSGAEMKTYATTLVEGVSDEKESLDRLLQGISKRWRLERMALVDRNLLRLAAYELTQLSESVPRKVVINEAIDLAKRYGSRESGAFANGILDQIGKS